MLCPLVVATRTRYVGDVGRVAACDVVVVEVYHDDSVVVSLWGKGQSSKNLVLDRNEHVFCSYSY